MRILFRTLLILWSLGAWWYYTCHIKNACWEDTSTSATTIPNQPAPKPLLFRWSSFLVPLDSGFPDLKEAILTAQSEDGILEITGRYFPSESNGEAEDIGIARATSIKKLLIDDIQEDRIRVTSSPFTGEAIPNDSLIHGIQFEWIAAEENSVKAPEEEPIEEAEVVSSSDEDYTSSATESEIAEDIANTDYFLKYFPYNEEEINSVQSEFLDGLASRLKEENRKVLIRGHTSSNGDKELNFKVGLRRAKKIRDQLLARGVNRKQIETTSQGEDAPIADNKTEEGRRKNTRVEIFIK